MKGDMIGLNYDVSSGPQEVSGPRLVSMASIGAASDGIKTLQNLGFLGHLEKQRLSVHPEGESEPRVQA